MGSDDDTGTRRLPPAQLLPRHPAGRQREATATLVPLGSAFAQGCFRHRDAAGGDRHPNPSGVPPAMPAPTATGSPAVPQPCPCPTHHTSVPQPSSHHTPAPLPAHLPWGIWVPAPAPQAREGAGLAGKRRCHPTSRGPTAWRKLWADCQLREAAHQQLGMQLPADPLGRPWASSPLLPPPREPGQGRGERHPFPIPVCLDPAHRWHFFSVSKCKPVSLTTNRLSGQGGPCQATPGRGRRTGDPDTGTWVTLPGPLGMARDLRSIQPEPKKKKSTPNQPPPCGTAGLTMLIRN